MLGVALAMPGAFGGDAVLSGVAISSLVKRPGESEVGEEAAVEEPGDGRDAVALQREHQQSVRAGDHRVRVRQLAAERGLTVGPRRHEPEGNAAHARSVAQEPGDGRGALVLVGLGRHRQPGVRGEHGDDAVEVAALDRVDEPSDELALARGARQRCALAAGRKPGVERSPRALKRALDRCLAALEHVRHLGPVKAEHVA
jgi:hypothetical protein